MMRSHPILVALAGSGLLLAGPAAADWLVLRDGSRVETRGAWEVRQGLVVFETASGALSSLRLGDVDLDASREATTAAAAAATERPNKETAPPPRRSIATITDADVGGGAPPPAGEVPAAEGEAAAAAQAGAAVKKEPALLQVVDWRRELETGGGTSIVGTLRNVSRRMVQGASLELTLRGPAGESLANGRAFLDDGLLSPGEVVGFRFPFDGYVAFERIDFTPGGRPLALLIVETPRPPPKENG